MLTWWKHLKFLRSCRRVCYSGRLWQRGNSWFWITQSGARSSTFISREVLLIVEKHSLTPYFYIPNLFDMMSLAITSAAGSWLWGGFHGQSWHQVIAIKSLHRLGTFPRNTQYGVFVHYKWILLCLVLFSGPRKREICVLVAKHKKKSAVTLKGVWSSSLTQTAFYCCTALLHCLSVETWDRSSQIGIGKHLVHIYLEMFASDSNCLDQLRGGAYFLSIFRLGTVSEFEVIN